MAGDNGGDNNGRGGDPTTPQENETGAYAQFTYPQLRRWSAWLAAAGTGLILALWIPAVGADLFAAETEHRMANLVAVWLLTFGAVAFLIGVVLQLAALRVAKLRTREEIFEVLAPTDDIGGIVKTIGDVMKSAKVPVAAMFVGAALMVTGGLIAFESVDAGEAAHEERVAEEAEHLEEVEREFEGLIVEICDRLERSDISPRRLGGLGELLADICR